MTIEEQYLPVTHNHSDCPVCNPIDLIQDVRPPRSQWDAWLLKGRNLDARLRILWGKKIEVKEIK